MSPSRRSFLKASAAALAAARIPRPLLAEAPSASPLAQFNYGDVELLEGPLRHQFDANHAAYSALNEDSLLQPFRQRAGLPAPGEEMGGWYSWAPIADIDKRPNNGFAPGHSFGQYLSGLSRDYAATGNKATQAKVHRLVRAFAPAITPHCWDEHRFPAYVYDKIAIGLIDARQFAGCSDAFKVLDKTLDSVQAHLPPGGISRQQQYARPHINESFCWDEPYTLPENAFLAWKRGAGQRYRDLAVKFLPNDWYFDPLAEGQNVLPGKHAYSHVNCLSSAAMAYLVLGDERYLRAARNGFDFLQKTQSFATGGWGPDEDFRKPGSGEIGQSLSKSHSSFETPCGSYAHFKITRYLARITRDSRYGDSMERVLYNCILGAKPLARDGHGFYYSDYNNDGAKVYHPYQWHCCTGTFSQVTADYGISAYFHDRDGVYVNLYVPSRLKWARLGDRVTLTQRTGYPLQPSTQIEVSTDKTSAFRVSLRIPAWAGPNTTIAVNGQRVLTAPEPGKFAALDRTWKTGDRIEVEFDMPTVLEAVDPEHPNLVAPVHGPLALFSVGAIPSRLTRKDLLAIAPVSAGSSNWQTRTDSGALALRPFASIYDEHYRLYLDASA
ncbi:twin-arginine translocation signal domain-containing protein [Acidobacteria bacterium AB60]|nr:twin-arginine translocation signal domain-containing protein [Acidobacteria bacterium AB60]